MTAGASELDQIKPWQIVLFVVAVVVVGASAYFTFGRGGPGLSHNLMLLDVKTGQIYTIDTSGKSVPIPARSPETGERTLYPVTKSEEGEWYLFPRAFGQIGDMETTDVLDMETGKVTVDLDEVRRITPKDLLKKSGS